MINYIHIYTYKEFKKCKLFKCYVLICTVTL